jgi:hypothetical protein
MIESGIVEALTASGTGRVKRNTGLARGSRTFSELRVVIWKPDQIFKKSGSGGGFSRGKSPFAFSVLPVFISGYSSSNRISNLPLPLFSTALMSPTLSWITRRTQHSTA